MKKKNFVSLILSVVGVLFLGIGMCMTLLPEWEAFNQEIVVGAVGLVIMLVMVIVRRKMEKKPILRINLKNIGIILFGILSALVFGVGMCMTMVWTDYMIQGIAIGCVGILLLLYLIPMCKGIK